MGNPKAAASLDSGIEQKLDVPDDHLVSWKMLKLLMRLVDRALPIGPVVQTPKGRMITMPGEVELDHAWRPRQGATYEEIYLTPGTVDGQVPTIGGIAMDDVPRPALAVDGVDLVRIYLKIPVRPIGDNKGTDETPFYEIVDGEIDESEEDFEVVASTTPPTGSYATVNQETGEESNGVYYRHVASYKAGVLTPIERTPLDMVCCDDGDGRLVLRFWRGPAPPSGD